MGALGIKGSGVAELGGVSDDEGDVDDALPSMEVSDDSDGGEFGAPIVEGGVLGAPVAEPGPFAAPGTVRPASASGSSGCFLLTVVLPSVGAIELSDATMRHRPRNVECQCDHQYELASFAIGDSGAGATGAGVGAGARAVRARRWVS